MMSPEGKVKAKIKVWLNDRDIWYFMPMPSGMGVNGIPDFICIWRGGLMLAIEAKAPGKRKNTTVLQDKQIAGILKAGGIAIVVDDVAQLDEMETRFGQEFS